MIIIISRRNALLLSNPTLLYFRFMRDFEDTIPDCTSLASRTCIIRNTMSRVRWVKALVRRTVPLTRHTMVHPVMVYGYGASFSATAV